VNYKVKLKRKSKKIAIFELNRRSKEDADVFSFNDRGIVRHSISIS